MKKNKFRSALYRFTIVFLSFVGGLIFIRQFVGDLYYVPTNSMEQTISAGDYIIANKMAVGIKLQWRGKGWRFPGYSHIRRGDVVLFERIEEAGSEKGSNAPIKHKPPTVYIKRCVALPGDTVCIRAGILFVNGGKIPDAPFAINRYMAWGNTDSIINATSKIDHMFGSPALRGKQKVGLFLTETQKETLLNMGCCDSIARALLLNVPKFRFPENEDWAYDDYGPIIVPKAGMSILLDSLTVKLYGSTIKKHEPHNLVQSTALYSFKNNYYFVLGDNRYQSTDSRGWGFVPEYRLIGRAAFKYGIFGVSSIR